eukprot:g1277.t1
MATWKAPRSCLSESLRDYESNSCHDTEAAISADKVIPENNRLPSSDTWDAMTELDSILHSSKGGGELEPVVVFGCTPPNRPTNPITRDKNFIRAKTTTRMIKTIKTPCKETWNFTGAPTCHTYH